MRHSSLVPYNPLPGSEFHETRLGRLIVPYVRVRSEKQRYCSNIFQCEDFSLRLDLSLSQTSAVLLLSSTQTFGMKESAHAIAGGRAGTAVVLLVGVQVGLSARRVCRERRGPT